MDHGPYRDASNVTSILGYIFWKKIYANINLWLDFALDSHFHYALINDEGDFGYFLVEYRVREVDPC